MATRPDPDWTRWLFASITEHFDVNVYTPNSIKFITEGIHERDTDFEQSPDRAEIRINGPFARELSARYWRIWVDINTLVTSNYGNDTKDVYTLERNLGLIHEFADTDISIRRYGTGAGDDGTLLGCLRPRSDKNDSVRVIHFGQLNNVDRIKQGQVDGRYVMYLYE
jgi:hypothetical protein